MKRQILVKSLNRPFVHLSLATADKVRTVGRPLFGLTEKISTGFGDFSD